MNKPRACRRDRRSVSPVVAMGLLILITIGFAAALSTISPGVLDDSETADLSMTISTEFSVDRDLDPHWEFRVTNIAGSGIDEDELRVRLVDDRGTIAENVYPSEFDVGDTLYVGLWGSPSRANHADCEVDPNDPQGTDNQLAGWGSGAHSTEVVVQAIHDPTERTLDSQLIELDVYPTRGDGDERHYILEDSEPSFNCDRLEWETL